MAEIVQARKKAIEVKPQDNKRSTTDDRKESKRSRTERRQDKGDHPSGRGDRRLERSKRASNLEFTPLNTTRSQILMQIQDHDLIRWPRPMLVGPEKHNPNKFCLFHKHNGHDTKDCYQLKREIENLVRAGSLNKYIKGRRDGRRTKETEVVSEKEKNQEEMKGGRIEIGRETARKRLEMYLNRAVEIANRPVHWVLIDIGASVDVLSLEAYQQFGFGDDQLKSEPTYLHGFSGTTASIRGTIRLPVTFGEHPRQVTIMVNFTIVGSMVSFNGLLGQPSLIAFRGFMSSLHLKMKFPTDNEVGEVRGDQKKARECFATFVKKNNGNTKGMALCMENLVSDQRDEQTKKRGRSVEDLVPWQLSKDDPFKAVQVGSLLNDEQKEELAHLLQTNMDVFT
ncbi:uncharacterized protein LOC122643396 [Telopea speciosissima]|uniref:uncharacterized protein LOC122643396 n=1 Tax=Telopea speciosissima TaxID=54955 RepID=UPI001CC3B828|nr:uncharacterized protein LOC122643396 [Telopea speciosissima]